MSLRRRLGLRVAASAESDQAGLVVQFDASGTALGGSMLSTMLTARWVVSLSLDPSQPCAAQPYGTSCGPTLSAQTDPRLPDRTLVRGAEIDVIVDHERARHPWCDAEERDVRTDAWKKAVMVEVRCFWRTGANAHSGPSTNSVKPSEIPRSTRKR